MTCVLCGGKGLFQIGYHEPPGAQGDLALCLCRAGLSFRAQIDRGVYDLLAAKYSVPLENVGLAEEFLDPEDIPATMRARQSTTVPDISDAGARHVGKAKL